MHGFQIEPNADLRQMATMTFEIYTAYLQAGFNEVQALRLTEVVMINSMNRNDDK